MQSSFKGDKGERRMVGGVWACVAILVLCLLLCGALAASESASAPAALGSPKGDELWSAGSKHYIHWQVDLLPARTVSVEYSTDGGGAWDVIAADAPNDGGLLWTVPAAPGAQRRASKRCRVRICAAGTILQSKADFAIAPSQEVTDYRWVNVTMNAAFAPRDGAGALTYKGKMWFLGGWNPGDKAHFPRICNNEVWCSTDGAAWTLVKPNTFLDRSFDAAKDWEGRHTAGYVVHKGKMWIVGGDANQGHYQNDVWNSQDGRTWTRVTNDVPWGPRVLHHTVAFEDKIWVMGGQTLPQFAPFKEEFHDDVWNSSDGVRWDKVEPRGARWQHRGMIGGSAVFKDRMWILGGGTYDTPNIPTREFYNDVWSSADGAEWERHVESAPWEPRQYHDVAVFDDRMWVMEGYAKGNRKDVWYSADGVNWYELPDTPWKPRHAASVFVYDGALWMVAGNNMESDVWRLERAPRGE